MALSTILLESAVKIRRKIGPKNGRKSTISQAPQGAIGQDQLRSEDKYLYYDNV